MMTTTYHSPKGKVQFELWVTGTVSSFAFRNLEALGIRVTQDVDTNGEFMD